MKYKIFGFNLWHGKIKNRLAKKYLNKQYSMLTILKANPHFANMGVGDMINDCSERNVVIRNIVPEYTKLNNGYILIGLDFVVNEQGKVCCMPGCGITKAV